MLHAAENQQNSQIDRTFYSNICVHTWNSNKTPQTISQLFCEYFHPTPFVHFTPFIRFHCATTTNTPSTDSKAFDCEKLRLSLQTHVIEGYVVLFNFKYSLTTYVPCWILMELWYLDALEVWIEKFLNTCHAHPK